MKKQRTAQAGGCGTHPGRPGANAQLDAAVTLLQTVVDEFARISPTSLSAAVPRRRLQGYLFGMLLAHGKQRELPPAAVLGAMTVLLMTRFGTAGPAADRLTRELINATQDDPDGEHAVLIRRGIAGMQRWTRSGSQDVVHDFLDCAASLGTRSVT